MTYTCVVCRELIECRDLGPDFLCPECQEIVNALAHPEIPLVVTGRRSGHVLFTREIVHTVNGRLRYYPPRYLQGFTSVVDATDLAGVLRGLRRIEREGMP